MRAPEGLRMRIRQMRRVPAATDASPATALADPASLRLEGLEERVAHLEELVEGLQDSVHRESQRTSKRIAELAARTEPAALAVALSRDARERGL
jgi:hypothetical protein